jgi:hypothetical protein
LKGLDGRAREYGGGEVARRFDQLACPIHHSEGPGMAAFNNAATGDFGNDGIGHFGAFIKLLFAN